MTNKILIALLLLLFIVPISSATAVINVKTLNHHKVGIFVLKSGETYQLLESFHKEADGQGKVSVTTTVSDPTIDVLITVKWENQQIASKRFDDLDNTGEINLALPEYLAKEETNQNNQTNQTINIPNNPANETNNTNTTVQQQTTNNNPLTGQVTEGTEDSSSINATLWIIIAAIIVISIFLFIMGRRFLPRRNPANPYESKEYKFKNSKDSSNKEIKMNTSANHMEKQLMQAEKKLQEAQMQINRLKNNKKIEEAERKLEEDRNRLQRLKAGYDN